MQTMSRLSRRALLSGGAASLALPLLPRAARAQSLPMTCLVPAGYVGGATIPDSAWEELGDKRYMTGGVQRPNDPRFVWLTQPENLRYYNPPARPGWTPDCDAPFGVVRPHKPEEVAYAIQWANKYKLPMVPRSGGHSYAGCSTVPGLVINSAAMRTVKYLEKDNLIEVGGGAIFGDLLESLRDLPAEGGPGRYTITHGRCRGVGLSAFLMGGGWAIDSCYLGMGCDRVKRVELVLADGSVKYASDTENPELFWAVRGGGGGNLAYATKWWLEPEKVENVVVFNGNWQLDYDRAREVFPKLFHKLDAAPTTLGAQMTLSSTSEAYGKPWANTITLRCIFHGTLPEFELLLRKTIDEVDQIAKNRCAPNNPCSSTDTLWLPYWDAVEFFEERGYPNRYQEISLFAREISDALINNIFGDWFKRPKTMPTALVTVYRVGGKVNKKNPGDMAFVHRSSKWMITTDIGWSDPRDPNLPDYLKWQRDGYNSYFGILKNAQGCSPGSYQNFPDPGLEHHALAYWGENLKRLLGIKKKYDPNNVFNPPRNQGIVEDKDPEWKFCDKLRN
jgi:hypothetical protein